MSLHGDVVRRVVALEGRVSSLPTLSELTESLQDIKDEIMQPIEELHMVATNRGNEIEARLHSLGQRVAVVEKEIRAARRQMNKLDTQLALLNGNLEKFLSDRG